MRIVKLKEPFPFTNKGPRTGLHLSDVIHKLDEEMGDSGLRDINDEVRMQFEKGWLWEQALSNAYADMNVADHPESIEVDGIWMSPDGISRTDSGGYRIEEYKCTAMNVHKSPADMWRWLMQVKGYCYGYEAVECVFRMLHLNSFVPVYAVWKLTFSEREIEENWDAVVKQAARMEGP